MHTPTFSILSHISFGSGPDKGQWCPTVSNCLSSRVTTWFRSMGSSGIGGIWILLLSFHSLLGFFTSFVALFVFCFSPRHPQPQPLFFLSASFITSFLRTILLKTGSVSDSAKNGLTKIPHRAIYSHSQVLMPLADIGI